MFDSTFNFAILCADTLVNQLKGHLIDDDLQWGETSSEELEGDIYQAYFLKLQPHASDIVHWFQFWLCLIFCFLFMELDFSLET